MRGVPVRSSTSTRPCGPSEAPSACCALWIDSPRSTGEAPARLSKEAPSPVLAVRGVAAATALARPASWRAAAGDDATVAARTARAVTATKDRDRAAGRPLAREVAMSSPPSRSGPLRLPAPVPERSRFVRPGGSGALRPRTVLRPGRAGGFLARNDPGRTAGTGMLPATVVPWPGVLRSVNVPPTASIRSAMPCRPVPRGAVDGSNPTPSSRTSNASREPSCRSSTSTLEALAYFAAFWSASRQQKYTAASVSIG